MSACRASRSLLSMWFQLMRLSVNFANEARLQPNLEAGKRNRQVAKDAKGKTSDCGFVFSICLAFSAPWRLAPHIEVKGNVTRSETPAVPEKSLIGSRIASYPNYSEINAATLDAGSSTFEGLLRAEARLTGGAFKSQTIPNHDSALRV